MVAINTAILEWLGLQCHCLKLFQVIIYLHSAIINLQPYLHGVNQSHWFMWHKSDRAVEIKKKRNKSNNLYFHKDTVINKKITQKFEITVVIVVNWNSHFQLPPTLTAWSVFLLSAQSKTYRHACSHTRAAHEEAWHLQLATASATDMLLVSASWAERHTE